MKAASHPNFLRGDLSMTLATRAVLALCFGAALVACSGPKTEGQKKMSQLSEQMQRLDMALHLLGELGHLLLALGLGTGARHQGGAEAQGQHGTRRERHGEISS